MKFYIAVRDVERVNNTSYFQNKSFLLYLI